MPDLGRLFRENNIIFVTLALCLIFYLISPRFLSIDNMSAISRQIVPFGLIALGQFFVVVSGNIDLSMGMGSVLFAIVLGVFFGMTDGVSAGIAAVIVGSLALGFFNGVLVAKLRMPAFIVTLSTLFVAQGLSGLIVPRRQIFLMGDFFRFVGAEKFLGFYWSFLFLVALFGLAYVVYNHTRWGAYVVAIGNSEENAKLAGINVDRVKIGIFMFSGPLQRIRRDHADAAHGVRAAGAGRQWPAPRWHRGHHHRRDSDSRRARHHRRCVLGPALHRHRQ